MADSLPTDDTRTGTARIEELLLAGLDYYFAGEHERAINVWTRVLFLDRGHARARAYIERARGALAERQRESEELVQRGITAFDEGRTASARELLSTAIEQGGPHDVAMALLERMNRLEAASQIDAVAQDGDPDLARRARIPAVRPAGRRSWIVFVLFVVALGVAALYVAISFSDVGLPRPAFGSRQVGTPTAPAQEALPVPGSADLAMWRATALKNAGHLKEALVALDRIGPDDAVFADAQRLRADVQALLLADLPLGGPSK